MDIMDIVRIKKFKKGHMNEFARVMDTDIVKGTVRVSNMNMPFQGSFCYKTFKLSEIEFVRNF